MPENKVGGCGVNCQVLSLIMSKATTHLTILHMKEDLFSGMIEDFGA